MQRLLRNNYLFVLLITLLVWGCKKDSPKPPVVCSNNEEQSDCFDYVFEGGEVFDTYVTTGPQYTKPFFNPNNADEFVYVEENQGQITLIKYSISTQQKTELCNSLFISGQPQWGNQGWIIFSVFGNIVWKITENGSQLSQVTPNGYGCYKPAFTEDGEKFIVMGVGLSSYYRPIFNLEGNIVDSIQFEFNNVFTGYPYCLDGDGKNGFYLYSDHNTPAPSPKGICKLNNNETIDILNTVNVPNGFGFIIAMCKNDQYLYYVHSGNGLYRLNISTHQVDKLQDNCQSKSIQTLSMSPDGTKILFERVRGHQTTPGGMVIDEQSEIFMYDVNTGEETKILWEE